MSPVGAIRTERQGHVAIVTIDRPAKLNAFTLRMYRAFGAAFREIAEDESIRCVLLQADGERAFCVGSDIGEFREALGQPERQIAETRVGRAAMDALTDCPPPIVVAVQGLCVGGGLQIAAGCDIRVAGTDARFGIPIKSLGMHAEIEDLGSLYRAMGPNLCLDLLLTGRLLDAAEALSYGFVHRLVDPTQVAQTALALATEIADGAPLAARWHKRAIRALAQNPETAMHLADEALHCYRHQDFAEGCAAFLDKRTPVFVGA